MGLDQFISSDKNGDNQLVYMCKINEFHNWVLHKNSCTSNPYSVRFEVFPLSRKDLKEAVNVINKALELYKNNEITKAEELLDREHLTPNFDYFETQYPGPGSFRLKYIKGCIEDALRASDNDPLYYSCF